MHLDLATLFSFGLIYLLLLFLIAYAAEQGRFPERLIRHPIIHVLSLGVYATSWTYYGSIGFAQSQGYLFLTIYLGVTIAFALSPVLLQPILRVSREYRLSSLADLFSFRYRSQLAGILVTLFMLLGALPYIALQIRAVTGSLQALSQEVAPHTLGLVFCIILVFFTIMFGSRHLPGGEKHDGLVTAIAFESLIKLSALLAVGLFALFYVFSGPEGLEQWLAANPEALERFYRPVNEGPWSTLLLLAFAAAFLLPRQFHMLFAENRNPRDLHTASWAFPLYLLLINLPIPILLWGGSALGLEMDADYYALGIALQQPSGWLPVVVFIGGLSSASAMMIVTTLALSSMTLNHILLPTSFPDPEINLYRWLLLGRRLLIGIIIMAGYGFYMLIEQHQGLVQMGLISFVAVAQFLPGILGLLYWPRANRLGFLLGLSAGIGVWIFTLLIPLLETSGIVRTEFDIPALRLASGMDQWEFATFWSLALNTLLFVAGSLLGSQSRVEQEAARACCCEPIAASGGMVNAGKISDFVDELAKMLGLKTAQKEVRTALAELGLNESERRPRELRRLRERLERNLSGLIGPQLSHLLINRQLRIDPDTQVALSDSLRYMDEQLEHSRVRLQGLSADLDNLRRYHRQILLDLPLGVCTIDNERQVTMWNLAMELMTGVRSNEAVGNTLQQLPEPWRTLLLGFASTLDDHIHHHEVKYAGYVRWFNLHKAAIPNLLPLDENPPNHATGGERIGQVMLLEDLTDLETLESELAHSDRLAFIGRLAAGVAHEVGNPLTAIASLAQNMRNKKNSRNISEGIEEILHQTRRISAIIQSLMKFSRSGDMGEEIQACVIKDIADEAIRLVGLTQQGRRIQCGNHCPDDLTLEGDRQALYQVLVNLLSNACEASKPGDQVELLATDLGDEIRIEILDQGEGIPAEQKERIFEPFYTTKQPGEGTGLGLDLVNKIVHDHQGRIEIDSAPGVGTRVIVDLPKKPSRQVAHEPDIDY